MKRGGVIGWVIAAVAVMTVVLAACTPAHVSGGKGSVGVSQVAEADSLWKAGERPQAAKIYALMAEEFDPGMSEEQASASMHACLRMWSFYIEDYSNVRRAMDYLGIAHEIAGQWGWTVPELTIDYALSYQNMANHTREPELYSKAGNYLEAAVKQASAQEDFAIMDRAVMNLITLKRSTGSSIAELDSLWMLYQAFPASKRDEVRYRYTTLLYEATRKGEAGDWAGAAADYASQLSTLPEHGERYAYMAWLNVSAAHAMAGDIPGAIEAMNECQALADSIGNNDMKASAYMSKSEYFKQIDQTDSAQDYYMRYCHVRDTITSYAQVTSLHEAEFTNQVKELGKEKLALEHRHAVTKIILWLGSLVMVLIIVIAVLVVRKNRQLARKNDSLYKQTISLIRAERERDKQTPAESVPDPRPFSEAQQPEQESATGKAKYSSRTISEQEKQTIFEHIRKVMTSDERIYSPDFSLSRLAEIVGKRPEYISQIINEESGQNYNNFINEYRVKEACRRISDEPDYHNLTLAAVAESVGIKSLTTFNKFFKLVTGMTPSQWRRSAREAGTALSGA